MDTCQDEIKIASLYTILQVIYTQYLDNAMLLSLLEFIALQLRKWHDNDISVSDLNNDTLALTYYPPMDWQAISLAKPASLLPHKTKLTMQQRAANLAALDMPDDYWRVFKHLYFRNKDIPKDFNRLVDQLRHTRSMQVKGKGVCEQDIWLWDEKSAQAMVILNSRSKKRYRKWLSNIILAWRV